MEFVPRKQSSEKFPSLTPTTVPWYYVSVTHLHCPTCDWSPGREMSDWCDVVKVFDEGYRYNSNHSWCVCVFLMASWLQFRWEGVWNVKWTCECRIENGWVERATEKSLMMMPYDAFYALNRYTVYLLAMYSYNVCHCFPFEHIYTGTVSTNIASKVMCNHVKKNTCLPNLRSQSPTHCLLVLRKMWHLFA